MVSIDESPPMGSPGEGPKLANLLSSKAGQTTPCSVVPGVRGVERRWWGAREDVVVNSECWMSRRTGGHSSSKLLLFVPGRSRWKQDCTVEKTIFPHSLQPGFHLQMTLVKRDSLELVSPASTEERNAQCTCQSEVHNAQRDGLIKGHWLFTTKPRRNLICLKINKFKEAFAPFIFRTRHVIHTYVSFFLAILRWCVYLGLGGKFGGGSHPNDGQERNSLLLVDCL